MTLKDLCEAGKCGLCCFFSTKYDYFLNNITNKEFIKEHEEKLIKRNNQYHIKLNKEVTLNVQYHKGKEKTLNPCSLLDIKINEEQKMINTMYCSIYPAEGEEDKRPFICKDDYNPVSKDSKKPCYSIFKEIKGLMINEKLYALNKEIIKELKNQG